MVDPHPVVVIWLHDEDVEVGKNVVLAANVLTPLWLKVTCTFLVPGLWM